MFIDNIHIRGFRNLKNLCISFSPKKNLIHGLNGAGKTSVLEAVFLLGFGKSFINVKKSEMINHDMDTFSIDMRVNKFDIENELSIFYQKNGFHLFQNEKETNLVNLNEYFYPVFFSSSDYGRTIESLPVIRKMINRFIFGVYPLYIHYILSYNKILKQKNTLLKTSQNLLELKSWNKMIGEMSEKIVQARFQFIEKLNIEIQKKFKKNLLFLYKPSFDIKNGISKDIFFQKLENIKNLEMRNHISVIGPHRDCFELYLDSKNLKFFSSGERKLHLLLIYLSYIELFKNMKNHYPVFLIDDFDTAFDNKNIDFLLQQYPEIQVIATSVYKNDMFDKLIELKKVN